MKGGVVVATNIHLRAYDMIINQSFNQWCAVRIQLMIIIAIAIVNKPAMAVFFPKY
jgi:hypothetical protein